jgi:zinc transport system substrate-binding protein
LKILYGNLLSEPKSIQKMRSSIFTLIILLLVSCGFNKKSQDKSLSEKPLVIAVNYPLHYFADRIGEELIRLEYPVPPDVDPAYWVPDDKALSVYQSADIILANGADYAKWMNNVSLPASRIINTSASMKEKYILLKDVSTHSHGPEGEHEHTGYAFTTWLDFEIAAVQAEAVKNALTDKLPDKKDELIGNYNVLKNELLNLNNSMNKAAFALRDQIIVGSHPVYQYLAEAYSLNMQSVHFEPDEMPTSQQWKEFDHLLAEHPSSIMLWEDVPLHEVKEILSIKDVKVIVFNPCGNKPDSLEFIEIMNQNINNLNIAIKSFNN